MNSDYPSFRYIYPPRPETKSPPSGLPTYERMGFVAQPKLNGSCAVLFLDGKSSRMMGRHNNVFAREIIDPEHLKRLHRGNGWLVLVGEYMNKSQKDSRGKVLNGFVIFDVLVHNGKHLHGTTFLDRQRLLDTLFPSASDHDDFIENVSPSVYRAKNFSANFSELWKKAVKVEMIEGFVLKRASGVLDQGFKSSNNTGWQVKIRRSSKNYSY